MPHRRGLFSTNAGKILFAYKQVLRGGGDARGTTIPGPIVAGNLVDESTYAKFFYIQAEITSVNQLLV